MYTGKHFRNDKEVTINFMVMEINRRWCTCNNKSLTCYPVCRVTNGKDCIIKSFVNYNFS
jgi:hypothetical protein